MEISVKRQGGYAGLTEQVLSVDTAQLPKAIAQQLEQAVRGSGLFQLAGQHVGGVGADMFRYEIVVREGNQEDRVTFTDDGSPSTEPLRRLVQVLQQRG